MKKINIILAVFLSLFISNYISAQWVQTNGPTGGTSQIVVSGSNIFALSLGIYKSTNSGNGWNYLDFRNQGVSCLAVSGTNIYAGVGWGGNVYRSTNGGISWVSVSNGLPSGKVDILAVNGSTLFAYINSNPGVFRSTNDGLNWTPCEFENSIYTSCLYTSGTIAVVGTNNNGIYTSTNSGNNWLKSSFTHSSVLQIISNGSYLFASTDTGLFRSSNNGLNWIYLNHNLHSTLNSLAASGTTLYASKSGLMCISTDNGENWSTKSLPLDYFYSFVFSGQYILGAGDGRIFRTTNTGDNWEQVTNGINCVTASSILSTGNYLFVTSNNGVSVSNNGGLVWTESNNGLPAPPYTYIYNKCLTSSGSNVFVSMYYSGIFRSSNYGASWIPVNNGLPNPLTNSPIEYLTSSNSNIYAASDSGIYRSTNNGDNWYRITDTLKSVKSIVFSGTNIFAVNGYRVYRSTNNGYNWVLSNNGIKGYMNTLAVSGTDIIAGGQCGDYGDSSVYISTNNGNNWYPIGQELIDWNFYVFSIKTFNGNIVLASDSGIFLSTNKGTNWLRKDQGFYERYRYTTCLGIDNNYLYAGVSYNSVWRRQLSEIISIQNISSEIPDKYFLYQNYPNPFNPSTKIRYQITNECFVNLRVYDILGKEITTLVNEKLGAGTYETEFSGSQLPSGIYFYKLTAGNFSETKKMLLIK